MANTNVWTNLVAHDGVNLCGLDMLCKAGDIDTTGITPGQVLSWDGVSQWTPTDLSTSTSIICCNSEFSVSPNNAAITSGAVLNGDKTCFQSGSISINGNADSVIKSVSVSGSTLVCLNSETNSGQSIFINRSVSGNSKSDMCFISCGNDESTLYMKSNTSLQCGDSRIIINPRNGSNDNESSGLYLRNTRHYDPNIECQVFENGGILRISCGDGAILPPSNGQILQYSGSEWIPADISNVIGEENVKSDWNESDSSCDSFIENKPVVPTSLGDLDFDYSSLADGHIPRWNDSLGCWLPTPESSVVRINSDWEDFNPDSQAFIRNKPTLKTRIEDMDDVNTTVTPLENETILVWNNGNFEPRSFSPIAGTDFTQAEKDKLAHIEECANYFEMPTGPAYRFVPETGGGKTGKVLTATGTNGTYVWADIPSQLPDNDIDDTDKVLTADGSGGYYLGESWSGANSDWLETDSSSEDFICNKPNIAYTSPIEEITDTTGGLMSDSCSVKLAGIEEGATSERTVYGTLDVAFGKIAEGTNVTGMSFTEIIEAGFIGDTISSISISSPSNMVLEAGDTQFGVDVSYSITVGTGTVNSIDVKVNGSIVGSVNTPAVSGSYDIGDIASDSNIKITVNDTVGSDTSNTRSLSFVYPYYYGTAASGLDNVSGLTKDIRKNDSNFTIEFTSSDNKFYFCYPASYGELVSVLDINNFETIDDWTLTVVQVTGLDGSAQDYNFYEFNNVTSVTTSFTFKK